MPGGIHVVDLFSGPEVQLIDCRSSAEYQKAHIPGAVNIPLLDNEDRAIVGTIYKNEGREAAVKAGFRMVGPRMEQLFEQYSALQQQANLVFYCWRGGLRSQISATILEWGGSKQYCIKGGYKAYRHKVVHGFQTLPKLKVLGGFTGCGKTEILELLQSQGHQIINLEAIANHKGSVLGHLGQPAQVSNEMFENLLWSQWSSLDPSKPVFIENESRKIGANVLPETVYSAMESAEFIQIQLPKALRLQRILSEYGSFDREALEICTHKIAKRLGGLQLKQAVSALQDGNVLEWAEILMAYYDRTYEHAKQKRGLRGSTLEWNWAQPEDSLAQLLDFNRE
jgi:tRNA 2-selenouridine synthase